MKKKPFPFSNWKAECIEIASKLLPMLCKDGAGLYTIVDSEEVRIGWPNLNDKLPNRILAIITPLKSGLIKLELRVGYDSGLISNKGPLKPAIDSSKKGQKTERDKGLIQLDLELHEDIEKWINLALELAASA